MHSPVSSVALTPLALLPAFLSQASSVVEPSLEFDRPVSKPGVTQASLSCRLNVECWWRARCKPPNAAMVDQRGRPVTVSASVILSATQHPPEHEMGLPSVSKPDYTWAGPASRPLSLELVWWERTKPPNMAARRRLLYETVNTLNKRIGSAMYPGRPLMPSNVTPLLPSCSSSLRPSRYVARCGCHVVFVCSSPSLDSVTSWLPS